MISYTPIENLKKTFGKMIAAFVEAGGLLPSQITAMMLETDYFDFFERDGQEAVKEYAEKSFSRMFFEIYHSELHSPVSDNVGPFYWAGIQYMNLFLNYQIPLKQLFLLCPLEKMISYFPVYHEMNEASLCKRVIESDLTQSILRALRKSRSLSVRQLSLLTGIKASSSL